MAIAAALLVFASGFLYKLQYCAFKGFGSSVFVNTFKIMFNLIMSLYLA